MTELSTNHAVWALVLSTAGATATTVFAKCAPWLARQGEKLVDAWCKRIEAGTK